VLEIPIPRLNGSLQGNGTRGEQAPHGGWIGCAIHFGSVFTKILAAATGLGRNVTGVCHA